MEKEVWHDIKGYIKLYQISNQGRVKSLKRRVRNGRGFRLVRGRILKPGMVGHGYHGVILQKKGKRKNATIARLVAQAFVENLLNKPEVNHIDGDKINNRVRNLEWATKSEQHIHAYRMGLQKSTKPMLGKFGRMHNRSKAVLQFDFDGNLISEYGSMREAERETGIPWGCIAHVCKGKQKITHGYIWKYAKAG